MKGIQVGNTKADENKTTNRIVTYVNDKDFNDFMLVLADRSMKPGEYMRLLLGTHLQALRDNNTLVINNDYTEEEDEDL